MTVEIFIERAVDHPSDLRKIAEEIHSKICAEQQKNPSRRTMATTLSAAIFSPGLMEFVHCGDSRITIARGSGIRRLMTDHSEAERLFASGAITKNEKANYPRKNILESALGIQGTPTIDTGNFSLMLGDKVFFSTDGFHNKVLIRELQKFSLKWIAPTDAIRQMNNEMKVRDPDDNYTLACIFVTV
jgi:serine/threonine protein phosphatase PrpC